MYVPLKKKTKNKKELLNQSFAQISNLRTWLRLFWIQFPFYSSAAVALCSAVSKASSPRAPLLNSDSSAGCPPTCAARELESFVDGAEHVHGGGALLRDQSVATLASECCRCEVDTVDEAHRRPRFEGVQQVFLMQRRLCELFMHSSLIYGETHAGWSAACTK